MRQIMPSPLPPSIADKLGSLGEPLAEFRTGAILTIILWVFGALGMVFGMGLLTLVLLVNLGVVDLKATNEFMGPLTVVGAIALAAGAAGIVQAWRSAGLRVFVRAGGLARFQGGKLEAVRWQDIDVVRRVVQEMKETNFSQGAYMLILGRKEGAPFVFNETLSGLKDLRGLVETHTLKHLLPPALKAVQAGQTVAFGPIGVSREGLTHGGNVVPWKAHPEAKVEKGKLIAQAPAERKPLVKVAIGDVPNYHVLLAMVEKAHKQLSSRQAAPPQTS
jgi:hypothetical protein